MRNYTYGRLDLDKCCGYTTLRIRSDSTVAAGEIRCCHHSHCRDGSGWASKGGWCWRWWWPRMIGRWAAAIWLSLPPSFHEVVSRENRDRRGWIKECTTTSPHALAQCRKSFIGKPLCIRTLAHRYSYTTCRVNIAEYTARNGVVAAVPHWEKSPSVPQPRGGRLRNGFGANGEMQRLNGTTCVP